jgi:hypothetical protein
VEAARYEKPGWYLGVAGVLFALTAVLYSVGHDEMRQGQDAWRDGRIRAAVVVGAVGVESLAGGVWVVIAHTWQERQADRSERWGAVLFEAAQKDDALREAEAKDLIRTNRAEDALRWHADAYYVISGQRSLVMLELKRPKTIALVDLAAIFEAKCEVIEGARSARQQPGLA